MDNENFVTELRRKLNLLQDEITILQKEVKDTIDKIDKKQKAAEHIVKLLELEGEGLENSSINNFINKSVSDIAYEFLKNLSDEQPLHYRNLYEKIISNGIPIPGKDPAANLLTHISRDERFVRVAPGTYGLLEWGLQPIKKSSKRKRKKS